MEVRFEEFASIEMPVQYEGVKGLALQASEEMSLAVSHYHTAYESEPFNENYADAAYQYYKNSYEYVQYMGYLLAGEDIPENDHVKVYEETNDKMTKTKQIRLLSKSQKPHSSALLRVFIHFL